MSTLITVPAKPARATRAGSPWLQFAGRRLIRMALSLITLIVVSFVMIALIPGDPARSSLGPNATAQAVAQRQHQLGLDKPLPAQFAGYIDQLIHGNFGTSFALHIPVATIVGQRWMPTIIIAILAFVVAVVVAIPVGLAAAIATQGGRRHGLEVGFVVVTAILFSIPGFILAVGLAFVFAVNWSVFPIAGVSDPSGYVLPVAALAIGPAAAIARIVRLESLKVLQQDYIRTARSKRMKSLRLHVRHVLPNTLAPTMAMAGLLLAGLLGGTVLVETVFAIPGLGATLTQSILTKDYPMVQALVLLFGGGVLVVNLAVDIAIALVDRRATTTED